MKSKPLGELSKPKQWRSLATKEFTKTGYPVYGANGIIGRYSKYNHEHETLVIGCRGACGFVHITEPKSYVTSNAMALDDLKTDECSLTYLALFLKYRGFADVTTGAAQPQITRSNIERVEIPLPPLDDQIRIAHLLGKVEGLIAKRKQQLQQYDDLLKSVFLEMFGDPVRNEKAWPQRDLESFIDKTRGISYGIVQRGDDVPGGVPVLRIRDIACERYVESEMVRTDPSNSAKYSRTILQGGELLLSIRGTVGVVSIAPSHAAGWNVSRELAVIPVTGGINVTYLVNLLRSEPIQRLFASMIKGVAQSGLNLGEIRRISAILPPADLQGKFQRIAAAIGSLTTLYKQSLTDLEALYGALSQQAFKGELDLSRVPLPAAVDQETQPAAIDFVLPQDESSVIPNSEMDQLLSVLKSAPSLEEILHRWLEIWLTRLREKPFSVDDFLAYVQTRLEKLQPDTDFVVGQSHYEHVKTWVFEALADGRLKQTYDDTGNRILLKAGSA